MWQKFLTAPWIEAKQRLNFSEHSPTGLKNDESPYTPSANRLILKPSGVNEPVHTDSGEMFASKKKRILGL